MNAIQDPTQFSSPDNAGTSSTISVDINELIHAFSSLKAQPSVSKSESVNSISRFSQNCSEGENKIKNNSEIENIQENKQEEKRPKISNWEGIGPKLTKFLMILSILVMVTASTTAEVVSYMPKHPMVCQNVRDGVLWSIPMLKECPRVSLDYSKSPTRKTLAFCTK